MLPYLYSLKSAPRTHFGGIFMKRFFICYESGTLFVNLAATTPNAVEVVLNDDQRRALERLNIADINQAFAKAGFELGQKIAEPMFKGLGTIKKL